MAWFWLNIPFAALCFLAWTLVPLWIVIKHPDTGPAISAGDEHPASTGPAATPAVPVYLPGNPREEALAGQH